MNMFSVQLPVNNVRTVSDTKRAFYSTHTRPINSIYRRVVEELMVEMHLLSVNVDFRYDPIYALGVVTSFDRFMQGYRPEADRASIFEALCQALGVDSHQYRQDAERLQGFARNRSTQDLVAWLGQPTGEMEDLRGYLQSIASNPKFKYSRLFAIGLLTLLEQSDSDLVKDETKRTEALKQISASLNLPEDKIQKDLELYLSNLEKMIQAQIVLEDILKADRKKREERAKAKAEPDAGDSSTTEAPKDEAPSGS